jgi:hypothetical protein
MTIGVISLVLTAVGALMVVIGLIVSLSDRKKKIEKEERELKSQGFSGGGDTLTGAAKLAEALKGQPLGLQLMLIGVVLLALAGASGGVGAVTATI